MDLNEKNYLKIILKKEKHENGYTEHSVLVKKSWFERNFKVIIIAIFILVTILKIMNGDFQISISFN